MAAASRMLIAEFDSPAQAARFREHGPREAVAELTGMLRIATLISGSVLVTDAMLLDGEYFMTLGPEGVLRELGGSQSHFPLVVTGTYGSLREGLEARRSDDGFRWSLPHPAGRPEQSREFGLVWDEWVRFAERGLIRYERQDGPLEALPIGSAPVRSPEHLQQLHESRLGTIRRRSAALSVIDSLPWDAAARSDVRRWWNDAYLRLIATRAAADWVSFESDGGHAPLARSGDVELDVSAALVIWARESTPATIAVAWDATASQRERLHQKPTWWRMRNLSFAATQVSAAPSRPGVLAGSVLKVVAAAAVIVLALPIIQLGAAENPWTWVAFAGAIATTLPFDALKDLIGLVKSDGRVRLVLHRGGGS